MSEAKALTVGIIMLAIVGYYAITAILSRIAAMAVLIR